MQQPTHLMLTSERSTHLHGARAIQFSNRQALCCMATRFTQISNYHAKKYAQQHIIRVLTRIVSLPCLLCYTYFRFPSKVSATQCPLEPMTTVNAGGASPWLYSCLNRPISKQVLFLLCMRLVCHRRIQRRVHCLTVTFSVVDPYLRYTYNTQFFALAPSENDTT